MQFSQHGSRSRSREGAEFQMSPMIDVVFLLLIFFICATTFKILEAQLKVSLPEIKEETTPPPVKDIVIEIRTVGEGEKNPYLLNGRVVTLDELTNKLLQIASLDKNQPIVVRGEGEAYHEHVVKALNACSHADLLNISIASDF